MQVNWWPLLFSGHVDPSESPEQEFVLRLHAWKSDTGGPRLGWLRGFNRHLYETMELHDGQILKCFIMSISHLFLPPRVWLSVWEQCSTIKITITDLSVCSNQWRLNPHFSDQSSLKVRNRKVYIMTVGAQPTYFWLKYSDSNPQHLPGAVQRHLWPVCWVWGRGGARSVCVSSPAALSSETPVSQHQRWWNGQFIHLQGQSHEVQT